MATVRVSDDVNARLKVLAGEDPTGRSVTQLVDEQLRRYVGLPVVGDQPPASTSEPAPRARASLGRPRARGSRPAPVVACTHPIGRRIRGVCMACGTANL